jgi:hypothetical protein
MAKSCDWVTAVGTALAAVAAIAAVYVADKGLKSTARQLQGTTIYNVAKDGKALQKKYLAKEADADEVMSYFYSVYRLHTSNVFDDDSWTPVRNALCRFARDKTIQDVPAWWASRQQLFDEDFRKLVNDLTGTPSCPS